MTGKKFKFRIDSEGNTGIKEVVTRSMAPNGKRIDVSVGVTNDFNLTPIYTFKDNIMVPLEVVENKGKKDRKKSALYYPIESVSYICTITMVLKSNQIKNTKLTIYIPKYIVSEDELYCERTTGSFSEEERKEILEKLLLFAKSRI